MLAPTDIIKIICVLMQNVINVFNNILDENNTNGWSALQAVSYSLETVTTTYTCVPEYVRIMHPVLA